jgi:hypothetical protein
MTVNDATTHTTTLVIFLMENRNFDFLKWRKCGKRFIKMVEHERKRSNT